MRSSLGKTPQYQYDAAGNPTATTTPLGAKTTSTYDKAGRVLSTTSARGNATGGDPAKPGRGVRRVPGSPLGSAAGSGE
ncbi:RHS repeat domain-containing protein [Streptomyces sp. AP-93]|uniref:RHS repeat domain-containing protein n=1 Tax=Streptomyces sp. AP-93 TaxID=2929048 RepID=UPI001FAEBBB9|nr:RHS repeat domain-containing protein [Streptomyces sp. AP-93]MCJ0874746.1 RHS repeat protein [Streptomyces sp. AP-93]